MFLEQRKILESDGYLIIRNFLSPDEVSALRNLCLSNKFEKKGSVILGDIISHKEFRDIIFSPKLISLLKMLIAEKLYYICDGTARGDDHVVSKTSRKFHADSRADDFDFDSLYPLYRMGFYLQDTDNFSGGLKIRPGSHKKLCIDHGTFYDGIYRFYKYLQKNRKLPPFSLSSGENIEVKAGDLVIWNMRLHHSGYAVRLKFLPKLSLHPAIENLIPKSWTIAQQDKRCAIFFAFGYKSDYLLDYFQYVKGHPDNIGHWKKSGFSSQVLQEELNSLDFGLLTTEEEKLSPEMQKAYAAKKFF